VAKNPESFKQKPIYNTMKQQPDKHRQIFLPDSERGGPMPESDKTNGDNPILIMYFLL
jgi:hypothetical protein